jgi:thiamine biosynthesis protein ThiS
MRLTINGNDRSCDDIATVAQLLQHLDLDPRTVVVELNRQIVRRPAIDTATVRDGDVVEIVHFVGGG